MTPQRKALDDHKTACRDIELTEAAITLLERVTGSQRAVAALKRSQHRHLARLDAAAEKLGAPYPRQA
ncbi:MAG: hypothetical protein RLZZ373_3225 [Pseudomonadota bacterium]|jgi:hypothetical protein